MLAKRSWRIPIVAAIVLGILLAAVSNTGVNNAHASEVPVSILPGSSSKTTDAFLPNPVYVNVGDTITWRNHDSVLHTVTSGSNAQPDGKFDSSPNFNPLMTPGQAFRHTFTEVGTFQYYCGLHSNMVGTVIVQSSSNETITVSIATGNSSYNSGDKIEITGEITGLNETASQPILIQVFDPEDNTDWTDQVAAAEDGSFSYSFTASALMNTAGNYTVVALYKNFTGNATFQFVTSPEEADWETFIVKTNDKFYHIRYSITGGRVVDMVPDVETRSFAVSLDATSHGNLMIELPKEVVDADEAFVAFVDEIPVDAELPAGLGATSTIEIDFVQGTEIIEIIGDCAIAFCDPPVRDDWEKAYIAGKFLNSEPPKPDQIFKIQYKVTDGTVERFNAKYGFVAEVNSTGNGTLEVKVPRNYPYTNDNQDTRGSNTVLFINGTPVDDITSPSQITDCFFVYSIPFNGSSAEIGLAWDYLLWTEPYHGDEIPASCIPETMVENVPTKKDGTISPLWQFRVGIAAEDAVCTDTKQGKTTMLLISPDARLFCVKLTDEGFMKRKGWTEPYQ